MKSKLDRWLDSPIDMYCDDFSCVPNIPPSNYNPNLFNKYYEKNDDDLLKNDNNLIQYLTFSNNMLKNYIEEYGNIKVYINPNTKRFYCSHIFKELINMSVDLGCDNIFNKSSKKSFYNFCMKYS